MPGFHRHLCKVACAFPLPLQLCMCIPSTSAFTHNCGAAVVTTPFITGSNYRRMSSVHETRRGVWHSWLHKSAHSVSRSLPERRRGGLHFRGCVALWPWPEAPYSAYIHNSKRRASKICVSIVEGIQIPHQLDHSGAYHQDVKDRMGAP